MEIMYQKLSRNAESINLLLDFSQEDDANAVAFNALIILGVSNGGCAKLPGQRGQSRRLH